MDKPLFSLLILNLVGLSISRIPINDSCIPNQKFNFTTGFIYKYEYEAEIETSLVQVEENSAIIRLNAAFDLQTISCRLHLTITRVNIDGVDQIRKHKLESDILFTSIRFDVSENGEIRNICTNKSTKATKIVEGIASLFQTANPIGSGRELRHRKDIDIFGECPTRFTILSGWKTTLVKREKNLDECLRNFRSKRSLPLVRGTQKCRQKFTTVLDNVECVENHFLNLFSNHEGGGAVTKVKINLNLVRFERGSTETNFSCSEMSFVTPNDPPPTDPDQLIHEMCKDTKRGLTSSILSAFENLSQILESFSEDELRDLLHRSDILCTDNPQMRTILLDAFIGVNSASSIALMSWMASRDQLPVAIRNSWFDSLHFKQSVDSDDIAALALLFAPNMTTRASLAVSTFVSTYCRTNYCANDKHVRHFLSILKRKIIDGCSSDGDDVLMALKSFGNLGFGANSELIDCALNLDSPVYLRVAAIEAFRRVSCSESREKIFNLYESEENSNELRIVAYFESMRCPTPSMIRSVERILMSETVNQVGSFVWTHLTNIRESTDECKAPLQSLLANIELRTKFAMDARKFSRFYETSFFSERLDSGIHSESYVIFPTDSYLPRSAMVNLTSDIFGRSVNLIQFSVRSEGLESLIENGLKSNANFGSQSSTNYKGRVDRDKLRIISQQELAKSRFVRQPQMVASIKIFGNEMWVWSSSDESLTKCLSEMFDYRHHFDTLADRREIKTTRVSKLIDAALDYPTGVGFALKTSIRASAALELNAAGFVDLRNLFTNGTARIEGHVRPNFVLRFVFGFHVEDVGFQLRTTLHSSAAIEGLFEMRGKRLIRSRIDVPSDKIFAVQLQHRLIRTDHEGEHEVRGIVRDRQDIRYCSDGFTSKPLGIRICGHASYPNASRAPTAPSFPLTGPSEAEFLIEKSDPSVLSYLFEYRCEEEELSSDQIFLLSFQTPRSVVDRQFTIEFVHNRNDKHVTIRLLNPLKKFTMIGNYLAEPNHKKIDATVTIDREKYLVQSEWRRETYDDVVRIVPNLYVRTPTAPVCELSGSIVLQSDKKLTIDLRLLHLTERPITLTGDVIKSERHPVRLDWNLSLDSSAFLALVTGSYRVDADAFVVTCAVRYSWRGGQQELIELLTKIRKTIAPNEHLSRLTCTSHLQLSAFREYDTFVAWSLLSAEGHVENAIQLGLGENASLENEQIRFDQIFSYSGNTKRNNLTLLFKFAYPPRDIDVGLGVNHSNHPRTLDTRISWLTSNTNRMNVTFNLTDLGLSLAKYESHFVLRTPNRTVVVLCEMDELLPRDYSLTATASWDPAKRVIVRARYVNKSHRKQLYHVINANLTVDKFGSGQIWQWTCDLIAKENHMHLLNALVTPSDNVYHTMTNLTRMALGKFNFHAKSSWPGTEYAVDVNTTLGDEKSVRTRISLAPHAEIVSYVATKIYDDVLGLDFDLMWDAKNNRSRRIYFGGEYRKLSSERSKGELNLRYPGRNLTVNVVKSQRGNWRFGPLFYRASIIVRWTPNGKIALDLNADRSIRGYRRENSLEAKLETPFDNLAVASVKLTSVDDAVEWQRHIVLENRDRFKLEANAKLTDVLDSRRSEASIAWRSDVKFDLGGWYVRGRDHVVSKLNFGWDDDRSIDLQLDMTDQSTHQISRIFGGFNLTTPWYSDATLAVRIHHIRQGTIVDSSFDSRWASSKIFRVHFRTSDDRRIKTIDLNVSVPIKGYENIGLNANRTMDENSFRTNAVIKWYQGKFVRIQIKAQAIGKVHYSNISVGFLITTPYKSFDVLGTNFLWVRDKQTTDFGVEFQWPTSKKFRIEGASIRGNRAGIERRILIRTPWIGYEVFGAMLSYKITSNRINCSFVVKREKPLIDCRITHNIHKNGAQTFFVLQTLNNIVRFKVLRTNKRDFVNRKCEFQLEKQQIRATTEIDIYDRLNWKANIEIVVEQNRLMKMDVRQENWNHETRIDWKEKPYFRMTFRRAIDGTIKGQLCLPKSDTTCKTQDNIVDVRMDTRESDASTIYDVQVDHPKFPFRLIVAKSDEGSNRTRIRGSISWGNESQTAHFDTLWFDGATGKSVGMTLIHPMYRTITFKCSYDKTASKLQHEMQFALNEEKRFGYEFTNQVEEKIRSTTFVLTHMLRIIKVEGTLIKDKKSTRGQLEFDWDVERSSDESRIILRAESINPNEREFQALIGFFHPMLKSEFVASGSLSYANESDLFSVRCDVNYSPEPLDLITMSLRIENSSDDKITEFAAVVGVVHLTTGIDSELCMRGKQTGITTQIDGNFVYKDRHEISHCKEMSVETNAVKKSIDIRVLNDGINRTMNAKISNTPTHYEFRVTRDKRLKIARIFIDKEHWKGKIVFAENNHSQYDIVGGFDDNVRRLGFKALTNGSDDPHVNARIELTTPYLVVSEIAWQTNFLSTLKSYVTKNTNEFIGQVQENWHEIVNELDEEMNDKVDTVNEKFNEFVKPITDHLRISLQQFRYEMKQMANLVSDSYDGNIFYVKDAVDSINYQCGTLFASISESITKSWHDLVGELERIHNIFTEMWWEWKEKAIDTIDEWCGDVVAWIRNTIRSSDSILNFLRFHWNENLSQFFLSAKNTLIVLYQRLKNAVFSISETVGSVWNSFSKIGSKISELWSGFKSFVDDHWSEFRTRFVRSELYLTLCAMIVEIRDTIIVLLKDEIYEPFVDRIRVVVRMVSEHPLFARIYEAICTLWSTIYSWFDRIVNDPEIRSLYAAILKIYHKLKWIVDYNQIGSDWKRIPIRIYEFYASLTQRRGYQLGIRMDTRNKVLFTPSEGLIRTEQHLPMPWYSLTQSPRVYRMPEISTIKWIWSAFSSRPTSIWEKYYQYRPYFSPSTWLPPFPTFAVFASDYFYVTMDGVHYAYSGDCVYILAHDFVRGNLSLFVDFSRRSPIALILLIEGKEIEILSNVYVNGKKSELPLTIGDASIVRQGNVIHVSSAPGTILQCHLEYEVCWLKLDGWYFGRTIGLFGTYNNEPNDDLLPPNKNTSHLEVGNAVCKSHVNRAALLPSDFEDECWSYFESELSYFKLCFARVDPMPFLSSCRGDFFRGLGLCRSALSYVSACDFGGIPLAMPHECVRCQSLDNIEMRAGDNVTVRSGQFAPSSDVVIIVELHGCNQQFHNKISDLIDSLDQALESNNVTSNRFSLVAFGGEGVNDRPHVRTVDGELFGTARQFVSIGLPVSSSGLEDAFAALQFSSNLPFRIGVTKIFVPLLCAPCERSSKSLIGMDYPEVHRMLIEDGISIHLLLDFDFDIKKSKDFYGMDAKRAYTVKDARTKRVMGDVELRHQVQPPKFICVPLALESNGTVFSSKRLGDGREKRKNFLDVFARRVAEAAARSSECQQCDCIAADNLGSGRVHCQPCHFPTPLSDHFDFGFLYDSQEEIVDYDENRDKQKTKLDKF